MRHALELSDKSSECFSSTQKLSLPKPIETKRQDFEKEDFEVETFLCEHAEYKTLQDIRRNLGQWESRFREELFDIVNRNFDEFLVNCSKLGTTIPEFDSIRLEILRFQEETNKVIGEIDQLRQQLQSELAHKRDLTRKEAQIKQLLQYYDLVEDLEQGLDTARSSDSYIPAADHVVKLSKRYVALKNIARELQNASAVICTKGQVQAVSAKLLSLLDSTLETTADVNDRYNILMAKYWVVLASKSHD